MLPTDEEIQRIGKRYEADHSFTTVEGKIAAGHCVHGARWMRSLAEKELAEKDKVLEIQAKTIGELRMFLANAKDEIKRLSIREKETPSEWFKRNLDEMKDDPMFKAEVENLAKSEDTIRDRKLLDKFVEWVATTQFAGDWKDWVENFLTRKD